MDVCIRHGVLWMCALDMGYCGCHFAYVHQTDRYGTNVIGLSTMPLSSVVKSSVSMSEGFEASSNSKASSNSFNPRERDGEGETVRERGSERENGQAK